MYSSFLFEVCAGQPRTARVNLEATGVSSAQEETKGLGFRTGTFRGGCTLGEIFSSLSHVGSSPAVTLVDFCCSLV